MSGCSTKQWLICRDPGCSVQSLAAALLIIHSGGGGGGCDLGGRGVEGSRRPGGAAVARFGSGPHHFLRVLVGFDQEDVTFGQEDAGQQAEARGQDGENLYGHHELATCAEVRRNEGNPHDEEDQHAEGHALPLAGK